MIEKIHFNEYLKLKDIDFNFIPNVNVLSGGNGTCKTSILYIISNSFKKPWLNSNPSLKILTDINQLINPKVESLSKSGIVSKKKSSKR